VFECGLPSTGHSSREERFDVAGKTAPQLVVQAARALYGEHWRSRMGRALDLGPRTVRRIGRAARTDEAQPVSPGVLVELAALARERAACVEGETAEGRSQIACLEMVALELDEAARVWTSTRRSKKPGR
jgi:hypothetical protein